MHSTGDLARLRPSAGRIALPSRAATQRRVQSVPIVGTLSTCEMPRILHFSQNVLDFQMKGSRHLKPLTPTVIAYEVVAPITTV